MRPFMRAAAVVLSSVLLICAASCGDIIVSPPQAQDDVVEFEPYGDTSGEPVPIRLFYQESGQNFPGGFDHANNWMINLICERANVLITELIVPVYTDTEIKFALMMSSGDIPDIVERADPVAMKRYGAEGFFLQTEDIISNSPVLSPLYDNVLLNAMRSPDGGLYVIQTPPPEGDFNAWWVRADLAGTYGAVSEDGVNYTLDTLVFAARRLKADDPASVPFSWPGVCGAMFWPFGVCNWQRDLDWTYDPAAERVISPFDGEGITAAVSFWRDMYAEELLDQAFTENTQSVYMEKRLVKDVLVQYGNISSMAVWIRRFNNIGRFDARLLPVNVITAAHGGGRSADGALGSATFGISKNAEDDVLKGVRRFLDVCFGDEIKLLSTCGREGIEYEIKQGVPTPIMPADAESGWRSVYGWAFTNHQDTAAYARRTQIMAMEADDSAKAGYAGILERNVNAIRRDIYGYNPLGFIGPLGTDRAQRRAAARELLTSLCERAITGEITMEAFAAEKDAAGQNFTDVTDALNAACKTAAVLYGLTIGADTDAE